MAESVLNSDVAPVSWAAAAGASARESGQNEKERPSGVRKRFVPAQKDVQDDDRDTSLTEPAHEIDSFA